MFGLRRGVSLATTISSSSSSSSGSVFCPSSLLGGVRFATKKAGGSTKNGRSTIGKRLGLKKYGGEYVIPGNIIIRQRGKTYHNGEDVGVGRDYTLWSLAEGWVKYTYDEKKKRQIVSVSPINPNMPKKVRTPEELAAEAQRLEKLQVKQLSWRKKRMILGWL